MTGGNKAMGAMVEKWGIFELKLESKKSFLRPFLDVSLCAEFDNSVACRKVSGFYDGDGRWIIRYMPDRVGIHTYAIESDNDEFDKITGSFECIGPSEGNHGPVCVDKNYHFSYADGTPFFVCGTTAYVWHYRPEEVRKKTLESFSRYGFNKIRMLFFPKKYSGGFSDVDISYEPPCYPFTGTPGSFDFKTPNPEYFRNFEDRLRELAALGIEADVILFHPYDVGHWGIDKGMVDNDDLFYIRYITSRLSAFRNVWWSLANEFDVFMLSDHYRSILKKSLDGWSIIGEYVKLNDPYGHLLSIHNFPYGIIYPDRSWMTHVSYQHPNTFSLLLDLKSRYRKPVINDEYQYEGNISDEWGNSSGELVLFRHWLTAMAGGYGTHGEVFVVNDNHKDLFWSYGGTMVGESAPRIRYMKDILESCPYQKMLPDFKYGDGQNSFVLKSEDDTYLFFYRKAIPGKRNRFGFFMDKNDKYEATLFDVWNCKIKEHSIVGPDHKFEIQDWTALRLIKKQNK